VFYMFRDPMQILLSVPAILLAIVLHELAHAVVAEKMGDPTPRSMGRITLNPLAHMDVLGLVAFLLIGFGWAKPVRINPNNFRNPKLGDILTSVAGPVTNFLIALVTILIEAFIYNILPGIYNVLPGLIPVFEMIAYLNIAFGFLNLLPIPPLDGYHILKDLIGERYSHYFRMYERFSIIAFFVAIFFILPPVFRFAHTLFNQILHFFV